MTAIQPNPIYERIVQKIAPHSRLLRAWSLKGGISAEMTALEIVDTQGESRRLIVREPAAGVLRRNPHAARDEYRLLDIVHSLGLAAPQPIYYDSSGELQAAPFIVIEYIDGQPEFAPADMESFTAQMASQLARIHRAAISNLDLSFLPVPPGEQDRPPAVMNRELEEGRIRDRLSAAGALSSRNAPALLHGDYWPGNILWQAGQLAGVIDWEDAHTGDPLTDFSISRLDILWILGKDAMDSFSRHYLSKMAIDTAHLPYWDLHAALRFIRLAGDQLADWAAFFYPFGRYDITEQTMREDFRFFIGQALE